MSKYCAVISGTHGEPDQEATIHSKWCRTVIENAIEYMAMGNKAVIAMLDSDKPSAIAVELMLIAGCRVNKITNHTCTPVEQPYQIYRVNSGGAILTTNGKRMIVCSYCGTINPMMKVVCVNCTESLYQGLDDRLYEYNRRLREGIRENDRRLISISKQSIIHTVNMVGWKTGWVIDANGYAKRKSDVNKREKIKLYYDEEDIDKYREAKNRGE